MKRESTGKVLLLEDDEGTRRLVRRELERGGFQVEEAGTVEEARRAVRRGGIEALVLDYDLHGEVNGLEFYREVRQEGAEMPALLVTGHDDEEKVIAAIREGMRDFLSKDESYLDRVSGAVERMVGQSRAERAAAHRREEEAVSDASEARFRSMVDSAPVLIRLTGPDGGALYFNRPWLEFTGRSPEAVRGEGWIACIHPEDRDMVRRALAAEPLEAPLRLEYRLCRRDGEHRWVLEQIVARKERPGRPGGQVASAVDITERKLAEEEVRELTRTLERRVEERTRELRQANEELNAYASTVAHDLRAPLRGIQGFAQAFREDFPERLEGAAGAYLESIVDSSRRMHRLIEDLLQYSRLGRVEVATRPVSTSEALRQALAQVEEMARQSGAEVRVEGDFPEAQGHFPLLIQALANLISNAIKFVEKGKRPRLRIRAERREDRVRLWVEDEGIGIAAEHHQMIFRPFERLHGREEYSGTGIGLAIVRRAMERQQGRAGLESEPGRGSRFWIELPSLS